MVERLAAIRAPRAAKPPAEGQVRQPCGGWAPAEQHPSAAVPGRRQGLGGEPCGGAAGGSQQAQPWRPVLPLSVFIF